jgi:hypothetical protein
MTAFSSLPPAPSDPWITLLPPAPEDPHPSWSPWATVDGISTGPRTIPYPLTFGPLPTLPPIPPGALGPPTELLPPARLASICPPDPWISTPEPPPLLCYVEPAPIIAEPPKAGEDESTPAPAPPAKATEPPPRAVELYPLEQCARLEARIFHRPEQTKDILEKNGLDAPGFQALVRHWQAAIEAELRQGKSALRREHDAAFVAELEHARGPLTPGDFARLSLAFERGDAGNALAALDLPQSAAPSIQRMTLARAMKNPRVRANPHTS